MVSFPGGLPLLPYQGLSKSRALDDQGHCSGDDSNFHGTKVSLLEVLKLLNGLTLRKVNLFAYHDCYLASAGLCHAVVSTKPGIIPAVVRFLVICWSSHHTMAFLHIPIGYA